jgi:hypothetical protein
VGSVIPQSAKQQGMPVQTQHQQIALGSFHAFHDRLYFVPVNSAGQSENKAGPLREAKVQIEAAIEVFKLNLFAYPDSADAHYNLADAYF